MDAHIWDTNVVEVFFESVRCEVRIKSVAQVRVRNMLYFHRVNAVVSDHLCRYVEVSIDICAGTFNKHIFFKKQDDCSIDRLPWVCVKYLPMKIMMIVVIVMFVFMQFIMMLIAAMMKIYFSWIFFRGRVASGLFGSRVHLCKHSCAWKAKDRKHKEKPDKIYGVYTHLWTVIGGVHLTKIGNTLPKVFFEKIFIHLGERVGKVVSTRCSVRLFWVLRFYFLCSF